MGKIAVIGTGYVGLTTGACFSHLGHEVVCADIDPDKIDRLNRGEVPILEAGLDEIVHEGLSSGRLRFVLGAAEAAAGAEFVYLCVPTPQGPDGSADMSYIEAAARQIAPVLESEAVVVNKSTVPVGSTRFVERALGRADVHVVSNPEFLREGSAVADFLKPDRVVIGSDDQSAAIRVASLYIGVPAPLMVTDPASAETIKYASNAFLATKLSFVNAVANVCEAVGADVNDVVLGMGYDRRIGHEFLRPGPGWGGSCFDGAETVLVRRLESIRMLTFERLFEEVDREGADGFEVLAWAPGDPRPEFFPVAAFTRRPSPGHVVEVRTKTGRRVRVTPDHPFVTSDGVDGEQLETVLAAELTTDHWLPVALDGPLPADPAVLVASVLDDLAAMGVDPEAVLVRLGQRGRTVLDDRFDEFPTPRRYDVRRNNVLRLHEVDRYRVPWDDGHVGTVNNGTFVPGAFVVAERFWRVLGLFLAEGHLTVDGRRHRLAWSFHPRDEEDLVEFVREFWASLGVRVSVHTTATSRVVTVSSRLLARWFTEVLGTGSDCYSKRIPDLVWALGGAEKRALLRGLWDGDGSWSLVNGGPSVVLEYGTVSRPLADGMVRLLGELGIVASIRVGRTAKSTVDTYWLRIAGAAQVERAMFLFPAAEREHIAGSIGRQAKRIAPTGHRRLGKGVAWVRVTGVDRHEHRGEVYSLEVPFAHTVVTSFGLIAHNCFPKDTRAMIRIAEDAGYHFDLLKGVISVNEEQFERTVEKIERLAGGSLEGRTVAVWGLTFKAGTDDLRESPALEVVLRLGQAGARVRAYDPAVHRQLDGYQGLEVVDDPYAACEGAAVLAVLTEWDELKWLDLDKVADLLEAPRVVDARNLLDRSALLRRGFTYQGIGRS